MTMTQNSRNAGIKRAFDKKLLAVLWIKIRNLNQHHGFYHLVLSLVGRTTATFSSYFYAGTLAQPELNSHVSIPHAKIQDRVCGPSVPDLLLLLFQILQGLALDCSTWHYKYFVFCFKILFLCHFHYFGGKCLCFI